VTSKISKKATEDIEGIWLYTYENWSLLQADRYVNLILDEIDYLTNYPESGKKYAHVRKHYRCSKVKSHLIFYRVDEKQEQLEIVRVLHERMDIESRL